MDLPFYSFIQGYRRLLGATPAGRTRQSFDWCRLLPLLPAQMTAAAASLPGEIL